MGYNPPNPSGAPPKRGGGDRYRLLGAPRPTVVSADGDGLPIAVSGANVEALREEWVVEDRWWTGRPLRRRYFELVLADGRDLAVFCDLRSGRWFTQRG